MKITVEIGEMEYNCYSMHNQCGPSNFKEFFNGGTETLMLINHREDGSGWYPNHTMVYESFRKVEKTKEQIAAEESVAKAREALLAAENALKVLTSQKEQKK